MARLPPGKRNDARSRRGTAGREHGRSNGIGPDETGPDETGKDGLTDLAEDGATIDRQDAARKRRRRRLVRISAGSALVLGVAVAGLWLARAPIADRMIADALRARGIQGSYQIARIGPSTQRIERLVIGNPAKVVGYVCICGPRLIDLKDAPPNGARDSCGRCGRSYIWTGLKLDLLDS